METSLLLERPVNGSTVLSLTPVTSQPRAAWTGTLPMSKNAPEQARHEAKWFLRNCRDTPDDLTDTAILIIDELVTNAYNAMTAQPAGAGIDFSLRLFPDRLLIEVIDTSPQHPTLNPPDDASAENGRGLTIVNALSGEWGYFWHQARKVVYAILPISPRAT